MFEGPRRNSRAYAESVKFSRLGSFAGMCGASEGDGSKYSITLTDAATGWQVNMTDSGTHFS